MRVFDALQLVHVDVHQHTRRALVPGCMTGSGQLRLALADTTVLGLNRLWA
jgi:hypothetical protein